MRSLARALTAITGTVGLVLEIDHTTPITITSRAPFRFPMLFLPGAHLKLLATSTAHLGAALAIQPAAAAPQPGLAAAC